MELTEGSLILSIYCALSALLDKCDGKKKELIVPEAPIPWRSFQSLDLAMPGRDHQSLLLSQNIPSASVSRLTWVYAELVFHCCLALIFGIQGIGRSRLPVSNRWFKLLEMIFCLLNLSQYHRYLPLLWVKG